MRIIVHLILLVNLVICLPAHGEIVVIVNKANGVDALDKRQLIDLYMGRDLYFPNGSIAFRLDHLPKADIRQQFYFKLMQKSVAEVNAYWTRLLFTGRASPPQSVNSAEEIIDAVVANQNAIAYIHKDDLVESVRVIARVQ